MLLCSQSVRTFLAVLLYNIQKSYNEEHGITPQSIRKSVRDVIEATRADESTMSYKGRKPEELTKKELDKYIKELQKEMKQAAADLQFERAAELRDIIFEYRAR